MSCLTFFISPGIGREDAAEAKARYDADDGRRGKCLDPARIRSVAAELAREHRLEGEERADEERIVEPDDPELTRTSLETLARPDEPPAAEPISGRSLTLIQIVIALFAVVLLSAFLHGLWLFLALVAVVLSTAYLLAFGRSSGVP